MGRPVPEVHAALEADWEVVFIPGFRVLLVEAEVEVLQPLNLLVAVVLGTLWADDVFDYNAAVLVELIAPVTVDCVLIKGNQILGLETSREGAVTLGFCLRCGGHFVSQSVVRVGCLN